MPTLLLQLNGRQTMPVDSDNGLKELRMEAAIFYGVPDPREIALSVDGAVVGSDAALSELTDGTTVQVVASRMCIARNALENSGLEATVASFHTAVKSNSPSALRGFVMAGINVDAVSPSGKTAALMATQRRCHAALQELVALGADASLADTTAVTPLYYAAFHGDLETVRILIKAGVTLNAGPEGSSPLGAASGNGHLRVVEELLVAGADVDGMTCTPVRCATPPSLPAESSSSDEGRPGQTTGTPYCPLSAAVACGHPEIAKVLVQAGADVTKKSGTNGVTPMYFAALKGCVILVKLLAAYGEGTKVLNEGPRGLTPLHAAIYKGNCEMAALLLLLGADPNITRPDGVSPACAAAQSGDLRTLETLLKYGADPAAVEEGGNVSHVPRMASEIPPEACVLLKDFSTGKRLTISERKCFRDSCRKGISRFCQRIMS